MIKTVRCITLSATLFASIFLAAAKADTIATFTLTASGCSASCGSGPYGTITLSDNLAGMVTVTETLAAGEHFANTGAGQALEYQLQNPSTPGLAVNVLTPGFVAGGADTASVFGSFNSSIVCSICANGGNINNPTGPVVFTVTNTAHTISIASFVANASGYFFAADILATTGNTGNVAAVGGGGGGGSVVPEPASLWLAIGGIVMVGAGKLGRRAKAKA